MNDADNKADEVIIRELVKAEEEAAMASFRTGHFRERLEETLRAADGPPSRQPLLRSVPRPVWVSAAALMLATGALLSLWLFRPPASDGSLTVASFLRQLPLMQAIEKAPSQIAEFSSLPGSILEKKIIAALSGPDAQPGVAPTGGRNGAFMTINPETRPMGLEELYNILIVNKSVERVLTDASQKTKEG
jgi:hypothetical protein